MNSQGIEALPHDIHEIIPYQTSLLDYWPWLTLAIGLLVIAVFFLWRGFKRRKSRLETPKVSPFDLLLQRFENLTPPDPFWGKARENYYYELSWALREAIELKLDLRATDMTWKELSNPLFKALTWNQDDIQTLLDFLQKADLVKFAGAEASRDAAFEAKKIVGEWISKIQSSQNSSVGEALDQESLKARSFDEVGQSSQADKPGLPSDLAGIFTEPQKSEPSTGPAHLVDINRREP